MITFGTIATFLIGCLFIDWGVDYSKKPNSLLIATMLILLGFLLLIGSTINFILMAVGVYS